MMTLTEIKQDVLPALIPTLTPDEKLELTRVIWEYDEFDAAIDEGLKPGGPLAKLRDEAIAEDERGETEEWP